MKKWGNLGKIVSKSDKNQTKALSTIFELFLTIFKDAELNEHIKINVWRMQDAEKAHYVPFSTLINTSRVGVSSWAKQYWHE